MVCVASATPMPSLGNSFAFLRKITNFAAERQRVAWKPLIASHDKRIILKRAFFASFLPPKIANFPPRENTSSQEPAMSSPRGLCRFLTPMFVDSTPALPREVRNTGMRGGGLRRFWEGVWRYLGWDGAAECPRAFFLSNRKFATAAGPGESEGNTLTIYVLLFPRPDASQREGRYVGVIAVCLLHTDRMLDSRYAYGSWSYLSISQHSCTATVKGYVNSR